MPPNVTCRTTHSIAYRNAKALFGDKDRDKVGNTYPSAVARTLGSRALAAAGALQTIQRWCGSLDEELTEAHVPQALQERALDASAILELARELRTRMLDPGDLAIRMPHDGYLKLFQLDRPVLRGWQCIATDEPQDARRSTASGTPSTHWTYSTPRSGFF